MGKDTINSQMDLTTRDLGRMTNQKGREYMSIRMDRFTRVNSSREARMVKDKSNMLMAESTLATGRTIWNLGKVLVNTETVLNTLANSSMEISLVMENYTIKIGLGTKVFSRIVKAMGRV